MFIYTYIGRGLGLVIINILFSTYEMNLIIW